jgi:uncharacterized protein
MRTGTWIRSSLLADAAGDTVSSGRIAQLVRAPRLHRGGRWFESCSAQFRSDSEPRSVRPGDVLQGYAIPRYAIMRNVVKRNGSLNNPFSFGGPVEGDQFTDREAELRLLVSCMRSGQNVVLLSPRRYGKTSLLGRAADKTKKQGGRVAIVNLMQCSTKREIAEELSRAIGLLAPHRRDRAFKGFLDAVRRHVPHIAVSIEYERMTYRLEAMPRDYDWTQAIRGVIHALGALGSMGKPVSLVLDEFQVVAEIDETLPRIFKAIVDEVAAVSLVFSGSKRHLMERIFAGSGAPLLGVGQRIALGPIPEAEMVGFIVNRMREGARDISSDAARFLYRRAGGIPNYVQQLAWWVWERTPSEEIREMDISRALDAALAMYVGDFTEQVEKLSALQRRIIRALSMGPEPRPYAEDFLRRVDIVQASSLSRALGRLSELEFIHETEAGLVVANPFLQRWLAPRPLNPTAFCNICGWPVEHPGPAALEQRTPCVMCGSRNVNYRMGAAGVVRVTGQASITSSQAPLQR